MEKNNPNYGKTHNEEARQKMSEAKIGKPSHKRNQEVWGNYHLIKDLHILNPELGYISLCKLFNETFGTDYPRYSIKNILPKIKEELVQTNS